MKRSTSETHIVTGEIYPSVQQKHVIEKLFSDCRSAYNCVVAVVKKQLEVLESCNEYLVAKEDNSSLGKEISALEAKEKTASGTEKSQLEAEIKTKKALKKSALDTMKTLIKAYGLTEYSLEPLTRNIRDKYDIPLLVFQGTVLKRISKSIDTYLWKNGEAINFKKKRDFTSIQNYVNRSALWFVDGKLCFSKNRKTIFEIPATFVGDEYNEEALDGRVKYPTLVRYMKKGEWHYKVQLAIEGEAPMKRNKQGEIRHPIKSGRAGLDVGTKVIAFVTEDMVLLQELCSDFDYVEDEKRQAVLKQRIDVCRRANNPHKYNEDGTCKKDDKTPWIVSKRQAKLEAECKEISRKQTAKREFSHKTLVNKLVGFADTIITEDNDVKGWQKKKGREQDANGKEKSRKNHGFSIGHCAPAMFVMLLDRNLKNNKRSGVIKIKSKDLRPTQYNHTTDTYEKHDLSERVVYINGRPYQRDLYSAYKLLYVNKAGTGFNKKALKENFARFTKLHDAEILRHKGMNNPKSMGIDILLAYLEMAQAA